MTTTTPVDLDAYRREARAWIAANLAARETGQDPVAANLRGSREYTREEIAAERPKQRALFDAGYAGITWPVEYGGQGLTRAHERTFLEEAAGFELPDFGYAGSMTFGVCAAVILAHASEDFKRRHLPRMLKGEELWVQFFSEPSGGSDLAGIRTRAIRGSSTAPKYGPRSATWPIGVCVLPARTGALRSIAGSRGSGYGSTRRVSPCG
jgi:alkylation response protein AidB-like acyl-CoA dehydrogenase